MKEEWRRDKYEEGERRMERKRRNNHNGWDGRNGTMHCRTAYGTITRTSKFN